jgi:hypothetical protein
MNSLATNQEDNEGRTVALEGQGNAVVEGEYEVARGVTQSTEDTEPSGRNITEMRQPDYREVSMPIIIAVDAKIAGVYEQGQFFPTAIVVKSARPVPPEMDIIRLLDRDQVEGIGSLVAEKIEREFNASR